MEVDFILQKEDKLIAIEVKSGKRTTNKGLPIFRDNFHPNSAFVVGSDNVPVEEFLLLPPEKLFL